MSSEIANTGSRHVVINGSILRIASVEAEWYEKVDDPLSFIIALKRFGKLRADLFTFMQRIPETTPSYVGYYMELDNVAAIPITTFEHWWTKQINDKTRNSARRLNKKGGDIRIVQFNDEFVKGISNIYNEVPIRRGKRFWHYGKSLDAVKKENGTFLERSIFIGAFSNNTLIGFIKLVYEPAYASIMQIISMIKHHDKAPTNALLAKAVELCAERKIPYLTYAKYIYGKKGKDTLSDFKFHNGFEKIDIPRYYIPLTWRGKLALKLRLHHGILERLPNKIVIYLLNIRAKWQLWLIRK